MEIVFYLIPIGIILGLIFLGAFIVAVKTDQYEDLDTPAYRILIDDNNGGKSEG